MSEFFFDEEDSLERLDQLRERIVSMMADLFDDEEFPAPANIYDATKALGDYCVENRIEAVVLPDRSARTIWVGLDEYLRLAHPNHPRPSFHFLNPDALVQQKSQYHKVGLSFKAADAQMRASHNALLGMDSSTPVLIFDTCIHEGEVMRAMRGYLGHLGFHNVRAGVFTEDTEGYVCTERMDFRFTADENMLACYPYGWSREVTKGRDDIYIRPIRDEGTARDVAESRRHYREIIRREFYDRAAADSGQA